MKKSLLDAVLDPKKLSVVFQPIFRVHSGLEVYALEALVRGPAGTNLERADILFDYVRRKKAEAAVDRSCLSAICSAAVKVPSEMSINVNVHALTLGQPAEFVDFFLKKLRSYHLRPERFTIEIVEHAPTCNIPELRDVITRLRDCGVGIALDDVGLGQSNYRMMLDCDPDYFKLDAYFARNLGADTRRRAVVQSVITLADAMDTLVVAEGVETAEDLAEVGRAGIELVQANILCPAMPLATLMATGFRGPQAPGKVRSMEIVAAPDVAPISRALTVGGGGKIAPKVSAMVAP